MEGWRVTSKGLGPLPRRAGSALAHGGGRSGRVVLPLARAAAVSTGLGVLPQRRLLLIPRHQDHLELSALRLGRLVERNLVRVRVKLRVRVRIIT